MRGFSLLELLITIVVIGILSAIAAPSFISFIKNERLTTNANQLYSTFKVARSEAIKREQTVSIVVNDTKWQANTLIDSQMTTVASFEPTHTSISVALEDITISSSGYLLTNYDFLITDNDDSTSDIRLCILISGQSWLNEDGLSC
ncbi:GspH/FimT family pseudopilin [Pseudoalteromonas sp. MMG010]|uniref:GspH/FimT family pseudopilin n=1 Tax=Pseudoalteromonas sp. MMG010 TaxID=2822685 RepID=UPI001B3A3CDA|nr:GspH/FimT family pseudopilin [Pseudoalteromonas sp. MMG010]MBQ4833522.1 GspH/FimT family pseudopilin [Pseudoalteromonas sp. MMG010]